MLYSESIENSVQLFDIPDIPEYKITCTGQVYSLFSKKFINPRNTSGRGYYNYILYTNGKRKLFPRHRLLCLVFKPIPNSENMQVDHINGIPGDDRLENLEWVTGKENVRRFWAKRKLKPLSKIVVKDFISNSISVYKDYKEAAKALNVHRYEILRRLQRKFGTLFKDYTMLKYEENTNDFPAVDNLQEKRLLDQLETKVTLYNHFTNEYFTNINCNSAAKIIGVSPGVITTRFSLNKLLFPNGFELILGINKPVRQLPEADKIRLYLSTYRNTRAVLVIDKKDKPAFIKVFKKAKDAAEFFSIFPAILNTHLFKNGKGACYYNNHWFMYIDKLTDSELLQYIRFKDIYKSETFTTLALS